MELENQKENGDHFVSFTVELEVQEGLFK